MFGLFRKKQSREDERFVLDLADFAADFSYIVDTFDPQGTEVIVSRAFNNYLERNPRDAGFTVSDFYLDAFTGAMFELLERSFLTPIQSLAVFTMVQSFLDFHPQSQTELARQVMRLGKKC
jgi:hypothetical protein